ncbi:MAG: gliding motility-associated-like protein [Flavobacteriales bacterium]|jgi:gliding motility-associated-like protein
MRSFILKLSYILLPIVFFTATSEVKASHFVGGNIGYEYIGKVGADYRYKILMTVYVDCGSSSAVPTPNQTEQIGIYTHDLQGNPMGGGDKTRFNLLTVNRISITTIEPTSAGGCSVGVGTCIREGKYEGFINLPANFTGYHLYADICCRNAAVVNVNNPTNEGVGLHAYMPPPLLPNSSPQFTDLPVPFLCVGDTTSILNSAYDADGDLLVFAFVDPFKGFGSSGNYPNPPATLTWPLLPNTPATGYDFVTSPFGAGGYSFINGSTGLTQYQPTAVGNYIVCVEIKEYRNGNLIGVSRRDIQLLAISCPVNPAPNIDPTVGTTSTQFTVEEGATLCFDFGYDDPNGDSLYLEVNGAIFDNALVSPNAVVTSPVAGLDTVSTGFCWTTGCGQSSGVPYQFQSSVTDNGCPPKTTNEVYEITITETDPPTAINGDLTICPNTNSNYTTTSIPNTTYNWGINNGTIVSDNGDNVDVVWNNPGVGTLTVNAINQYGCPSQPISLDVTVLVAPTVDAGVDTVICYGDTLIINATTNATPGYSLSWNPTTTMLNSTTLSPSVFPLADVDYVLTVDQGSGCVGIDSIKVLISQPAVNAGVDTVICNGDSIQLNGSATGANINWTPIANLSDPAILNPFASPVSTQNYVLNLTDSVGCVLTDTMTLTVQNGFILTTSSDTTICENECFNLFASGASTYAWESDVSIGDTSLSSQSVCPPSSLMYTVYAFQGVCKDTAMVNVTVNTLPVVEAGIDQSLCIGDTVQLAASGAVGYLWSPSTDLSSASISNPDAFPTATTQYYVVGTDGNGCSNLDSLIITVNAIPALDAGDDVWLCPGASANLSATGTGAFNWTPVTGLSDPSVSNPLANPSDTTEYVVELIDANNCVITDTLIVYVGESVPTDAGADTTICEGDTIQIGGAPTAVTGTVYLWSPALMLDDPTIANPMVFPTTTTWFVVQTSNDTCSGIDSVLVTVNASPIINAGLDVSICENDTVGLQATGGINYTWNADITLSATNISNPNAFPIITTEYQVMGADLFGCQNWDTVEVTVNNLPNLDAGIDTALCINDTIMLNASGALTYSWSPLTDIDNEFTNMPSVHPTTSGYYYVEGTDINTCTNIDSVFVTVYTLPIVDAGLDTSICIGDSVQLQASGAVNYSWQDGTFLSDTAVSNPFAGNSATMDFIIIGEDINGCFNADTVNVLVNTLPVVSAGADDQICINDTAQLLANGALTYVWDNITSLTDETIDNPQAFPIATTLYAVIGTGALGCANVDTVEITVNSLPIIDAGIDTALCINDTIGLLVTGTLNYQWSPAVNIDNDNTDAPSVYPTTSGYYYVEGIDANTCMNMDSVFVTVYTLPNVNAGADEVLCIGDSVQLQATGAVNYSWQDGAFLSDTAIANPFTQNTVTTDFILIGQDINGCFNVDTVNVLINALPVVDAGADVQICLNDTAQLLAAGANSYTWVDATTLTDGTIDNPLAFPTDTTQYTVSGIDFNGCMNVDSVIVVVNPFPVIDAGLDVNICNGDSTQLLVTGADSYVWSPSVSLSNELIDDPMAGPDSTVTYVVIATDTNMCLSIDSVTVNVFRISTVPDTSICLGDSAQLDVFGSPSTTFNWTPSADLSDNTIANPWASPAVTTIYTVSVSDNAGCNDQASVEVTILEVPEAVFDYSVEPACTGISVQLENLSNNADSVYWMFSNDSTSTEFDPLVVFDYDGSFDITLITYNNSGCVDSIASTDLADNFEAYYDIRIPNVFTPNGDNENDVFLIEVPGKLSECVDLNIFNRWGQLVYKSYGNLISWDGYTPEGTEVPEGNYFYTVEVLGKEYSGNVTLFR